MIEPQVDEVTAVTGIAIKAVTADAGYSYGKVYGALQQRGINALIPAKAEPIRSRVPLRRFRYDAKHDILKCPTGRILRPARPIKHGRFFYSKARDCARCPLKSHCLSKGRVNKAVVVGDHYPLCSAPAAAVSAGPQRTFGSISVIAGARRAFMARPRHGTDLHAPSGAASPT